MAFSISARALKGLAIGALEEDKRHRLAAETRVDEQVKFDRANDAAKEAAALQAKNAMARTKVTAGASVRSSQIAASASIRKAQNAATIAEENMYDDYGLKKVFSDLKLPGVLPKYLKYDRRTKGVDYSLAYFGKFNGAFAHTLKALDTKFTGTKQKKAANDAFDKYLDNFVHHSITSTGAYAPKFEALTNRKTWEGGFDLETASPEVYKRILDGGEERFPKSFKLLQGINLQPIKLNPASKAYFNNNKNDDLRAKKMTFAAANDTVDTTNRITTPEHVASLTKSLEGTPDERQLAANKLVNSRYGFNYNKNDPDTYLDFIILSSVIPTRAVQRTTQAIGGVKSTLLPLSKDQQGRLSKFREKLSESRDIMATVVQARELNANVTDYGRFQLNFIGRFETILSGIGIGLTNKSSTSPVGQFKFAEGEDLDKLSIDTKVERGLFQKILDKSNQRIISAREIYTEQQENVPKNTKTTEAEISAIEEKYLAEVKYEAIKIQLVYKIAKLIQGGAGGQAVSNADFQAVLKSMSSSGIGTLKAEEAIFGMLQNMVERVHVYNKIMSDETIFHGSQNAADKAMSFIKRVQKTRPGELTLDSSEQDTLNPVDKQPETGSKAFNALPPNVQRKLMIERKRHTKSTPTGI